MHKNPLFDQDPLEFVTRAPLAIAVVRWVRRKINKTLFMFADESCWRCTICFCFVALVEPYLQPYLLLHEYFFGRLRKRYFLQSLVLLKCSQGTLGTLEAWLGSVLILNCSEKKKVGKCGAVYLSPYRGCGGKYKKRQSSAFFTGIFRVWWGTFGPAVSLHHGGKYVPTSPRLLPGGHRTNFAWDE